MDWDSYKKEPDVDAMAFDVDDDQHSIGSSLRM